MKRHGNTGRAPSRRCKVYDLLIYLRKRKTSPTVEQMVNIIGVSLPSIYLYLKRLEKELLIVKTSTNPIRIQVTEHGRTFEIPLPLQKKTHKKASPWGEWTNPYKGLSYEQRLDAIEADAIQKGTHYHHATLSSSQVQS